MGYTTRNNGQIKDFWPDDTADTLYLEGSATLQDILQRAREKWGAELLLDHLTIAPEHIHTRCLTYDLHDPSDYDNFLCITYTAPATGA